MQSSLTSLVGALGCTGEGSPYENDRPHALDRSRHIALKKPSHLPVKVASGGRPSGRCLTVVKQRERFVPGASWQRRGKTLAGLLIAT
jgi:hypothetical protein